MIGNTDERAGLHQVGATLSVEGVHKRFSGVHALDNVSIQFQPGQVHCLAGENGSGKSTLIKLISGVEMPDSGVIHIDGHAYGALTPRSAIRAGVQVIYQDLSLFPNLTVAENIVLPTMMADGIRGFSWKRAVEAARHATARIDVDLPLEKKLADIPIAQRQLTAICRALVQNARIMFMDEPTTALTQREVSALFAAVRVLCEQNVAVVFVSHKFNEVLEVSDKITVLRDGKVVADGPVADFDRVSLSAAMTGQGVAMLERRHTDLHDSGITLSAEHIGLEDRLFDVSFVVHSGEILGVTGLLGSGRNAIAEALFGIAPITSGQFIVEGTPVSIGNVNDAINSSIGYVPSDRLSEGLFVDHSIAQNIVAASTESIPRTAGVVTRRSVNQISQDMVKEFDIKTPSVQVPIRTLSGGNQQRVVLAKWFVRKPKVLMLNGPTVGVDIGSKKEIMSLLRDLASAGTAIIVISDDLSELAQVADRIMVMREGSVASELSDADITEERILAALRT